MFRSMMASLFVLLVSACTTAAREPAAEGPRADPWADIPHPPAAEEAGDVGQVQSPVVVGPNGLVGLWCSGFAGGQFNSLHTPRYVTDAGDICTSVLVTLDDWILIHPACVTPPGAQLGQAQFAFEQDPCGGTTFSEDLARFPALEQVVDSATGWARVRLGGHPAGIYPTAKLGTVFGVEALTTDPVFVLSHQVGSGPSAGVLVDRSAGCRVTSAWSTTAAGRVANSGCDLLDPAGRGAPIYFNSGVSAPAIPGRVFALYDGPNGTGQNRVRSFADFACPTCLFGPLLTDGNFVQ